jgi:hypothetical protein
MHAKVKLAVGVLAALLIAVAGGWIWGASGSWENERALREIELRNELLEGRTQLLDARLSVYDLNFGDASRHFEDAKGLLRRAAVRLNALGRGDEAKALELAVTTIDDAQRMAGQLDQAANKRAAEAVRAVSEILGRERAQ